LTRVPRCRVCGGQLYARPLLHYRNMPGAAQFMPDENDLASERGADLDLSQCSACGLVQLLGEPVPYFREVVRAAAFSPEMRGFRLEQFRGFADHHDLMGRKVLEVGCGAGEYLALMREVGLDAHGLEYSATSVAKCRSAGLPAFRGFVDRPRQTIPGGPYAAFLILGFLEHMPRPVSCLRGVANNLTEGAVGLVEVPNFEMIAARGMFSEFIADHLTYFTKATLGQTLAIGGFDLLDCRPVWHDYILSAVVRKRTAIDLSHLTIYQQRITDEIATFLDRFASRRVAIWGAGHQSLAVISLLSLQDRVSYVVDSAPFKQGLFTPASHIAIVPPTRLRDEPMDGVLVMAASYSDEVAALIRRDYDAGLTLAILRDDGLQIL